MSKFAISIVWSDEDQVFISEVPELPGCVAHGATREEALANAQAAMELWIEVARKRGRQIPVPEHHRRKVA